MAFVDLRRKPGLEAFTRDIEGRIRLTGNQGTFIVRQLRDGRGGVAEQFLRQGEMPKDGGFNRWKRSQRAEREGNFTLIDKDNYRQAWRGRNAGSVAEIRGLQGALRVRVGVDPRVYPHVLVFQADAPTRTGRGGSAVVAPRPVSISKMVLGEIKSQMVRVLAGGASEVA